MQSPDVVMFEKSTIAPNDIKIASEKQVLYVNDSNNASYNGSITIDSTVLSNSGRYLDWSEAYIEVPIAVSIKSSAAGVANLQDKPYLAALKAGHFQLIDSIQVDIQNKNVVQSQSYTNFYTSYRVLSNWSEDDIKKYGSLLGVHPDADQHYAYVPLATTGNLGKGIVTNIGFDTGAARDFLAEDAKEKFNEGMGKRTQDIAQSPSGSAGITTDVSKLNASGVGYLKSGSTSTLATWYVIATIRLKDVSDLFSSLPLLKGAQVRFTIQYNAGKSTITYAEANNANISAVSTSMIAGRTLPVMISSNKTGNPFPLGTTNGTVEIEYNVLRTTLDPVNNPLLPSSRLYVPAYALIEDMEVRYLQTSPVKEILYDDIYQYTINKVSAGSPFNQLLTNGIVAPQKLIIVPMLNRTHSGNVGLEMYQSPFCSAPFTTFPQGLVSQLQVLISGRAIFDQPVNYSWEQFSFETSKSGVSGGLETGVASGLISYSGFNGNYSYIVVDLSRRMPSDEIVPKSVQVLGTNNTSFDIDYYCFITYKRSLSVELATGRVL